MKNKYWDKFKKIDLKVIKNDFLFYSTFLFLLIIYLIRIVISPIGRIKFVQKLFASPLSKLASFYEKLINFFDTSQEGSISHSELIRLAIRHLKAKKARTIITIGGMAIGIGSIVFLLSLGYGFQRLIVSRVARLDEMKQIDVSVGKATSLFLNKKVIKDFKNIKHVKYVLPMVSLVSKVSFNNSVSDVVAYGVTSEFLKQSAIKPVAGDVFDDADDVSLLDENNAVSNGNGQVAGLAIELRTDAKMKKEIYEINYAIYPLEWKPVYQEPSNDSNIIGYTQRVVGQQEAVEVWGGEYEHSKAALEGLDDHQNRYDRWVKDSFPLWEQKSCESTEVGCVDGDYLMMRVNSNQLTSTGFITEDKLSVERFNIISDNDHKPQEGEQVRLVQFSDKAGRWLPTYSQPKETEQLLGLFSKVEENKLLSGELFWGGPYLDEAGWGNAVKNEHDQWLGYWVKTTLPMWRQVDCEGCENYFLVEEDEAGNQDEMTVYLKASDLLIDDLALPVRAGEVLGEATGSAEISLDEISTLFANNEADSTGEGSGSASSESDLSWVEIASAAAGTQDTKTNIIELNGQAQKVAVVNRAMLRLLGIEESQAVGKVIKTTLLLDNSLFADDYQAESTQLEFKVIGVIPNNDTPAFYFPFGDLQETGIDNYSSIKVVVQEKGQVKEVRSAIESMGFKTSSVVDTVGRINALFDNVRLVLLFLGMIALGVAALGMFNTLTVSLLEKTREVGLMKAMGMKSDEVKKLFLAESITIGIAGGVSGLVFGFALGKLISFVLSTISITKGLGVIDVVFIPTSLAISIIILSLGVGVLTGIFPARRTTKISALNALRYE